MSQERKILGVSTLAVIALILIAVGATYAFFKGSDAGDTDTPLEVTTNTTDSLVFNVDTDISMVADMSNFTEGKGNREGISHATATLKANNKTNSATGNYYLYFDIKENELAYTTDDNTAELLLQVNGPDGLVTSINGLNYVTVTDGKGESVSGFDITEVKNLITIASNKEITTTSEKVETYEIKVILVNLNEDQSANGGKKFNGEILIQKEVLPYHLSCEDGLLSCEIAKQFTGVQGENNIYYHESSLVNSAGDKSYRYAGSYDSVNNYVCFGSEEATCPHDNLYRIIGVFGDQVKLIKADYAKSTLLGTSGDYKTDYKTSGDWGTNKGSNAKSEIGGYYWNNNNENLTISNIWANSKLNKENLNEIYLNNFDADWQSKIATISWKVGGNTHENIEFTTPVNVYQNEVVTSTENTTYKAKIGLMYVSDYMYGASPNNWTKHGNTSSSYPHSSGNYGEEYDYRSAVNENWMYGGLMEWTISRCSGATSSAFYVYSDGHVNDYVVFNYGVYGSGFAVRPVFYLESSVVKTTGTGTLSDPMRIQL